MVGFENSGLLSRYYIVRQIRVSVIIDNLYAEFRIFFLWELIKVIFVINEAGKLSLKMNFIVQTIKLRSDEDFFYVFRKGDSRFVEEWGHNQVNLATSLTGNFMHFLLMMVKSPQDMRDGLLRRFLRKQASNVLLVHGFLSCLSQSLSEYFEKPTRTNLLIDFLRNLNSPKVFLIDEYVSVRIVNLKILKLFGPILYVSQDVAYDHFNFGNNVITKTLMYKLERDAVSLSDLVVACSERDQLKYLEMGAKNVLFYPNIYPITEFEPACKDAEPCISIVLRGHWGAGLNTSLEEIFKALACINRRIKVNLIGIDAPKVPKNVDLQHHLFISSKKDYLTILSKSWIGINVGIHLGGTNERKYDYAMAGLIVFSDSLGSRGDLLPHEYVYVDRYDLTAKLNQILEYQEELIKEMGLRNRKQALYLAEMQKKKLLSGLKEFVLRES
jgi:hypothetical protein